MKKIKKIFELKYNKESTFIDFSLTSEPLTFKTLKPYLTDMNLYRILSEKGDELVEYLELMMKSHIDENQLTCNEAKKFDQLLKELKIASKELSRAKVHPNPGESSGMNGVLMVLKTSLPESVFDSEILNEPYPTHDIFELLEGEIK